MSSFEVAAAAVVVVVPAVTTSLLSDVAVDGVRIVDVAAGGSSGDNEARTPTNDIQVDGAASVTMSTTTTEEYIVLPGIGFDKMFGVFNWPHYVNVIWYVGA